MLLDLHSTPTPNAGASLSLYLVDFPQLGYPLCNDRPRLV